MEPLHSFEAIVSDCQRESSGPGMSQIAHHLGFSWPLHFFLTLRELQDLWCLEVWFLGISLGPLELWGRYPLEKSIQTWFKPVDVFISYPISTVSVWDSRSFKHKTISRFDIPQLARTVDQGRTRKAKTKVSLGTFQGQWAVFLFWLMLLSVSWVSRPEWYFLHDVYCGKVWESVTLIQVLVLIQSP